MTDPFSLRVSLEELVYLIHALKLTTIPGIPEQPLEPLGDDQQALALAVADRSLRARGIVSWQSSVMRRVDSTIAGLISTYGQPRYILTIDAYVPAASLPIHTDYVFNERFAIDHVQVERGVHQFFGVNNARDALERLEQLMPLTDAMGNGMAARISQQTFHTAQQLARQEQAQAGQALVAELPVATANGLAAVLAQPVVTYNLALAQGGSTVGKPVMIIAGKPGLYLLTQQGEDYTVMPVSAQQARHHIADLLQPVLAQMPDHG